MLTLTLSVTMGRAQEPDQGEMLYENHCTECHESIVHVREQPTVKTFAELEAAVRRWSDYKQLAWADAERNAVRDYLNQSFYGFFDAFPPPPPAPEGVTKQGRMDG